MKLRPRKLRDALARNEMSTIVSKLQMALLIVSPHWSIEAQKSDSRSIESIPLIVVDRQVMPRQTGSNYPYFLPIVSSLLCPGTNSHRGSAVARQQAVRDITFKGRYINHEYGYSVLIPNELVGFAASPPAPQHGFGIILSHQPKAEIWVDGTYNAALWTSLDAAATSHLNRLGSKGKIEVLKKASIRLQGLKTISMTIRSIDRESGIPVREEFLTAIREHKGEVGIVYEISLTTAESRYRNDMTVYKKLIAGWRFRPLAGSTGNNTND
jgi:hypothetical protein